MEITDQETKNKILDKISRHLNVVHYYDSQELSLDEAIEKYGYAGFGLRNFVEVRFYAQTNGLTQLTKMLSTDEEYFILPIDNQKRIYKGKIDLLHALFTDHLSAHVIIAEKKFNWILIKDEFNKLTGIGDQLRNRMKKMIHLTFDNERIMHQVSDEKAHKQEEI